MEVANKSIRFMWALPNSAVQASLLVLRNIIAGDTQHCLTTLELF